MSSGLATLEDRASVLPRLHPSFREEALAPGECGVIAAEPNSEGLFEPVAGFICVIEYENEFGIPSQRLVTCKSLRRTSEGFNLGAVCHAARGFRSFKATRITAVYDATTGELLGSGDYFRRFAIDEGRERVPTFGLMRSRAAHLIAGLNVLAFMARCDGLWHPLEEEPVERFICSLWMRKEWPGDPPLAEVLAHARRLAPDSDVFFRSLRAYARSTTSSRVLLNSISALIEADGVICGEETDWVLAMQDFLMEEAALNMPSDDEEF